VLTSEEEARWQFTMIEKVVGAAIIGLLAWMALTVQQTNVDVAVIKEQLASADRHRFTNEEGKRLGDRIQRVEERVEIIEGALGND